LDSGDGSRWPWSDRDETARTHPFDRFTPSPSDIRQIFVGQSLSVGYQKPSFERDDQSDIDSAEEVTDGCAARPATVQHGGCLRQSIRHSLQQHVGHVTFIAVLACRELCVCGSHTTRSTIDQAV